LLKRVLKTTESTTKPSCFIEGKTAFVNDIQFKEDGLDSKANFLVNEFNNLLYLNQKSKGDQFFTKLFFEKEIRFP
jgi:hypothetical protein